MAVQTLETLTKPADAIAAIQAGLSYNVFYELAVQLGIDERKLAHYTQVPERTLKRRKEQGRFTPDESNRIYLISDLFHLATEVLESEQEAAHWLRKPKRGLSQQVPLELARTLPGAQLVRDLLGRIEYGVYW